MNEFWTTFFYIVVLAAVLVGAYFTTRFISGKSSKMLKGRYIQIIDRMPLGRDKNVVLIEVGDKALLVGVTNQSINTLGQIDGEAIKAAKEQTPAKEGKGFVQQFRDFLINAKDAQENLRKARMQAKAQRKSSGPYDNDFLTQLNEAMERRREQMDSKSEDEE
ncbi:MAG: flagellar biosynthetic protein FliO [Burkholderiales bacterium]